MSTGYCAKRKAGKPLGADFPHYPNKQERKMIARLCQKAGVREEELRKDLTARRRLAEAAQSANHRQDKKKTRFQYKLQQARRSIAARLGVPPYHPDVTTELHTRHPGQWMSWIERLSWSYR